MTTNIPASVFARLKNWAKANRQDLQYVLLRYGNERILYRLSALPESHAFVLKGATMFLAWTGSTHRATKDIDLLGYGDPSPERLVALFRLVAAVPCDDDGVVFDADSVESAPIREGLEYGGVRITVRGLPPLLLLDEVSAHLDQGRRAALCQRLLAHGGQVWLTGTEPALFDALKGRACALAIANGRARLEEWAV